MNQEFIFDRNYAEAESTLGLYKFLYRDEEGKEHKFTLRGTGDKPYESDEPFQPQVIQLHEDTEIIPDGILVNLIKHYFGARKSYIYFFNSCTNSYFDMLNGEVTKYDSEEDWKRAYHSRGRRLEFSQEDLDRMKRIWDEDEAAGSGLDQYLDF